MREKEMAREIVYQGVSIKDHLPFAQAWNGTVFRIAVCKQRVLSRWRAVN